MVHESEMSENVRPLLTLAIATYNRARFLRNLLSLLVDQLADAPEVELIISDNASADDTSAVVKEYQERGLRVRYIRNETNVGMDRNLLQCFKQARGKYFWLFGDDDLILPGGIAAILPLLKSGDHDLIYMAPYNSLEYHSPQFKASRQPPAVKVLSDPISFAHRVNLYGDLIYISSIIVNLENLQAEDIPFEKLVGTYLMPLGWVLSSLKTFRTGLFLERGIIVGGFDDPSGGFSAAKVFGENYYNIVTGILGTDSKLSRTLINDLLVLWFPRHWLGFRRGKERVETDNPHRKLRPILGSNFRYWFFAYPLFGMPLRLAVLYSECLRLLRRS